MIKSESDDRTANNGVRHQYRVLSEEEKADMVALKDAGAAFLERIDLVAGHYHPQGAGPGRELALARTKVEEAVMWAVTGITK